MSNNALFNLLGGQSGPQNILQQFEQFRRGFTGDARQQVQALLNSGRVTQAQYNRAAQMATQLQRMLGGR